MLAASRLVADGLLRPSDGLPHKGLVVTGQAVATLLLRELESPRERLLLSGEVSANILPTTLHEVSGELATGPLVDAVLLGESDESGIEEADE
jgi:hypothetical protein